MYIILVIGQWNTTIFNYLSCVIKQTALFACSVIWTCGFKFFRGEWIPLFYICLGYFVSQILSQVCLIRSRTCYYPILSVFILVINKLDPRSALVCSFESIMMNHFTSKISLVTLPTVCHTILILLVWRVWYWINL